MRAIRIECIQPKNLHERGGLEECHRIRRAVFMDEQHVPLDLEMDDLDDEACHFLAHRVGEGRETGICGTARMRVLQDRAKAERVAVLADARRLGIGRALMRAIEETATELGLREVVLNAQSSAIPFYEAIGYRAEGPEFEDAGIPHRAMRKALRAD